MQRSRVVKPRNLLVCARWTLANGRITPLVYVGAMMHCVRHCKYKLRLSREAFSRLFVAFLGILRSRYHLTARAYCTQRAYGAKVTSPLYVSSIPLPPPLSPLSFSPLPFRCLINSRSYLTRLIEQPCETKRHHENEAKSVIIKEEINFDDIFNVFLLLESIFHLPLPDLF